MRKVFGLLLVLLGVWVLLEQFGLIQIPLTFWPTVGVLVGGTLLWKGIERRGWLRIALGLWVGAMGLFEILHDAELLKGTQLSEIDGGMIFSKGWPVFVIGFGLAVIFRSSRSWWKIPGAIHIDGETRAVGDLRYGHEPWTLDGNLEVKHGAGDVKIDFSTADIAEGIHHVRVKQGVGELLIRVPDNVEVSVNAKVGVGEMLVLGERRSGAGLTLHKRTVAADAKAELKLDVKLGAGQVRIYQVAAQPPRLV
jgi:hypothetical protein